MSEPNLADLDKSLPPNGGALVNLQVEGRLNTATGQWEFTVVQQRDFQPWSKRDEFAARALPGYIAAFGGTDEIPGEELAAKRAYEYADAMLAERSRRV